MGGYTVGTLPDTAVGGCALQVYAGKVHEDSHPFGKLLCQVGHCSQHRHAKMHFVLAVSVLSFNLSGGYCITCKAPAVCQVLF